MPGDSKGVSIDIWGCCVSRDIFGICKRPDYIVKNYIWSISFVSAFSSKPELGGIVSQADFTGESNFLNRMRHNELNNGFLNNFPEYSPWLVVDFRSASYGLRKITFPDGSTFFITANSASLVEDVLSSKGVSFTSDRLSLDDFDYRPFLDKFIAYCKEHYGDNIILIETREALYHAGEDGSVQPSPNTTLLRKQTSIELECSEIFTKGTGCWVVHCPDDVISDDCHKWGPGNVHYIREYYDYAMDSVDSIVSYGLEARPIVDSLFVAFKRRVNDIHVAGTLLKKACQDTDSTTSKCEEDVLQQAMAGDIGSMTRVCRMYRSGKGLELNLAESEKWARALVEKAGGWAYNELFDTLWAIGTPSSDIEMVDIAMKSSNGGNFESMGRLGRAYREGRGVQKDLEKSAEWMRRAADGNVAWAQNELFDVLWTIGTPESYAKMIDVANKFAENGNYGIMGRLGRAYREGRGVPKDLEKSAEWMRRAADGNVAWARNELAEIEGNLSECAYRVVYSVGRISSFWRCVVHKLSFHADDSALFILNTAGTIGGIKSFMRELPSKMDGIGDVHLYSESNFFSGSEEDIMQKITAYFDSLTAGMPLDSVIHYVCFDKHSSYSAYLISKGVKYTIIDYGGWACSDKSSLEYPSENYRSVMLSSGALNNNENVSDVICIDGPDMEYDYGKPHRVIDFESLIYGLNHGSLEKLFRLYDLDKIARDAPCTGPLILTSSLLDHSYEGSERQFFRTYAALADYFLGDDAVVKPHPAVDCESTWEYYFGGQVIRGHIPFEVLMASGAVKPASIVSTGSSARHSGTKTVDLTTRYPRSYQILDKLFCVLTHISQIDRVHVSIKGRYDEFLPQYIDAFFPTVNVECDDPVNVTILGNNQRLSTFLPSLGTNDVIVDLNADGLSPLNNNLRNDVGRVLVFRLTLEGDCTNLSKTDGEVLLYTGNARIMEQLRNFRIDRHLTRCNQNLSYRDLEISSGNLEGLQNEISETIEIKSWMRDRLINVEKDLLKKLQTRYKGTPLEDEIYGALVRSNPIEYLVEMESGKQYLDDHPDCYAQCASAFYSNGELEQAERYALQAVKLGPHSIDLVDLLRKIGTPKSLESMISMARDLASEGQPAAFVRLGRAYRDGMGVDRDLEKAAACMRSALEKGSSWICNELFDVLWRTGTADAYDEMVQIARQNAEKGDAGSMLRLGKAYRDGKGVGADLGEARHWIQKAYDSGLSYAKKDLDALG